MQVGPLKKKWRLLFTLVLCTAFASSVAFADDGDADGDGDENPPPFECDARFDDCGTPELSGGGGGNSAILIANTDLGTSYQHSDDWDNDGIDDAYDNCPFVYNPDQTDTSGDGVGDACDNCPNHYNPDQTDTNGNGIGDACDPDISGDGIPNEEDNCPYVYNPDQADTNGNGIGDACDPDINGNGILNEDDPCPYVFWDPATEDPPLDDPACMRDTSGDGVPDFMDNCPYVYNPDQTDTNGNGIGDACDPDIDGDGIPNAFDNCPNVYNPGQEDADRDGVGDACDDHFCFVVLGDQDNCLDPEEALAAYSPAMVGSPGEPVRLRLFANHNNQALRYTWRLLEAPEGSDARIVDARGTVSYSSAFEYRYLGSTVPHLLADLPGEYRVQLEVESIWEDRVTGQLNTRSVFETTVTVDGDPVTLPGQTSCSSTQNGGTLLWLVAGFGLLAFARRRKQTLEV